MCAINNSPVGALSLHFGLFPVRSTSSVGNGVRTKKPSWRVRGILCTSASSLQLRYVSPLIWHLNTRVCDTDLAFESLRRLYDSLLCVLVMSSVSYFIFIHCVYGVHYAICISVTFILYLYVYLVEYHQMYTWQLNELMICLCFYQTVLGTIGTGRIVSPSVSVFVVCQCMNHCESPFSMSVEYHVDRSKKRLKLIISKHQ